MRGQVAAGDDDIADVTVDVPIDPRAPDCEVAEINPRGSLGSPCLYLQGGDYDPGTVHYFELCYAGGIVTISIRLYISGQSKTIRIAVPAKDARVWFLYEDSADLELPSDFRFEDINHEIYQSSREIFSAAISPCILPVGIHQGRNIQVSYEFYHPMSSARQLGMGQLLIGLFFADKIQCRGEISSTLMMDRLLNLLGPPLGSIENIELAMFRRRNFDRWWGEWKLHLFHQPASMYMTDLFPDVVPQTTESSPPRQSNSGKDIHYAPGLIPNGGGPSPPVIGYDAPKTSALLQGLIKEPADAGKKRKTRSSAVNIAVPTKKKKTRKTKPADDLPTLDPSIEQALDEEIIEDEVDQAAAEPPPPSPSVHQSSSDQTSSAVGSHHIEEEIQPIVPAIPVLADLFSFDIKDYLDEGEEDTTSKALAPLSDDVKKTLEGIGLICTGKINNPRRGVSIAKPQHNVSYGCSRIVNVSPKS
uniref:Retrotransposon protein, putative, unclassified n=2 Tax=Oryza sativa subsp. japonica TaxID=39947 RepID=Q53KM7_ORYSJ|nr:retrotransposon protein, putative, unclassified [Oryza sativa Japonica Group]AAX94987.1 retrotransposon protein, putative, unclassified [Oryza sativa Japonica Group]ABA93347.1 retrotransposon, putative, centromere-specific [Oryza sativa Japonica Group]